MSQDRLRVGIAGFGVVGRRRYRFIAAHPDLLPVAVADQKFADDRAVVDGLVRFRDYRRLLAEDLDVLFVCLSNDAAAAVTIAGLENGMHVFCEKPPGRDLDEMTRVMAVEAKNPKLKLKYGFNHRYHDSVIDALEIVRSGALGGIINLRGVYGKSKIINFESDWRTERAISGGGILLDQGIHMVDLMRLFAGEFREIHSFVSNSHWHHDVEDNAYAIMRTQEGVIAMLHSTATQWRHRFNLEIALTEGALVLGGLLTNSKSYGAETLTIARKTAHDRGDPVEELKEYASDPSFEREIAEFAAVILNDSAVQSGNSGEAYGTMETVFRIYCADASWAKQWDIRCQSASAGRVVSP